eukprot:1862303-Rhodomonas_salina.1
MAQQNEPASLPGLRLTLEPSSWKSRWQEGTPVTPSLENRVHQRSSTKPAARTDPTHQSASAAWRQRCPRRIERSSPAHALLCRTSGCSSPLHPATHPAAEAWSPCCPAGRSGPRRTGVSGELWRRGRCPDAPQEIKWSHPRAMIESRPGTEARETLREDWVGVQHVAEESGKLGVEPAVVEVGARPSQNAEQFEVRLCRAEHLLGWGAAVLNDELGQQGVALRLGLGVAQEKLTPEKLEHRHLLSRLVGVIVFPAACHRHLTVRTLRRGLDHGRSDAFRVA